MAYYNSVLHDGTTIEIGIEGVGTFAGIVSVGWGVSVDTQKVTGTGQKHIGSTPGLISVDDASMEIYLGEHMNILEQLGGNTTALLNKRFDVTVTYNVPGERLISIILTDCRIINYTASHTLGSSDAATITYTLQVMGLEESAVASSWQTANVGFNW